MSDRLLRRRISLADGTELRTTRDAHALIVERFAAGAECRIALDHALVLLRQAAASGKRADIKAATDQLVLVLRQARMM
jgi:hypothetical protein